MLTLVGTTAHFSPFWEKVGNWGSILAPLEIRRGTLNLTFSVRWSFKVVNFEYESPSRLHWLDFIVDFIDFGRDRNIDVF